MANERGSVQSQLVQFCRGLHQFSARVRECLGILRHADTVDLSSRFRFRVCTPGFEVETARWSVPGDFAWTAPEGSEHKVPSPPSLMDAP